MTITITTAHNDARLGGTLAYLDTGTGNAAVRIYGGTRPATPADVPTSAMLVQVGLTKPAGSVAAGVLTLTQLEDGLIAETGIATWARVVNGNGDTAFDCDCGGWRLGGHAGTNPALRRWGSPHHRSRAGVAEHGRHASAV